METEINLMALRKRLLDASVEKCLSGELLIKDIPNHVAGELGKELAYIKSKELGERLEGCGNEQ